MQYVDYQRVVIPEGNTFWPFVHKRRSFEHERELRAITAHLRAGPRPPNIRISVDLGKLIENVFVAPTCPHWFAELVGNLLVRYGLPHLVPQRSSLDDQPLF